MRLSALSSLSFKCAISGFVSEKNATSDADIKAEIKSKKSTAKLAPTTSALGVLKEKPDRMFSSNAGGG